MTASKLRTGTWPTAATTVVVSASPVRAEPGRAAGGPSAGAPAAREGRRRRTGRATLDAAILEILRSSGPDMIDHISVEMVAERVGISRATAYRHLTDRNALLARALLLIARGHVLASIAAISRATTACAKIEESFAYVTREAVKDETLMRLRELSIAAAVQPSLRAMSRQVLRQVITDGQRSGELRLDVGVDTMADWVLEQQYLTLRLGLSEDEGRQCVNTFVLPALRRV
jgi:AcrR family transcriptional regulator